MLVESDIEQLGKAISLYETLLGKPLSQLKDLSLLTSTDPRIIQILPKDPWGAHYQYTFLGGKAATFIIWSEGSLDTQEGLILYSFSKQGDEYISTRLNSTLN
ncbi:type II secretion system protein GspG [Pseudoalteromonas luteoviolacea]|uniref:type II secretion system protein GspG n=1 Tax=Pseudoalteromonas luteoviolacea TaxID=43657 RepID=UPI0018C86CB0|nr:type II secretion system protein GspG [Pseudoalteromonas luteoviolacea]